MKFIKTPMQRLVDFGRRLAMLIFVMALGIVYAWNFQPSAVDYIGEKITKLNKRSYEKLYQSAEKSAYKNGVEGLNPAINLASKLSEIKKMDRLAPKKRMTFDLIATTYEKAGNHTQALYWLNQWIAFDEKDLIAEVRAAQAMLNIPAEKSEGVSVLNSLYRRVPEAEFIAKAYMGALLADKQYVEAFKVPRNYALKNYTSFQRNWLMFWDIGNGFTAKLMTFVVPEIDANGIFSLNFELPAGVKRVRLDPPPNVLYKITKPKLSYAAEHMDLWKLQLGVHDAWQSTDGVLTTGGGDPYFFWDIPEDYAVDDKMTFTAEVGLRPLDGFKDFLLGPSLDEIEKTITDTGDKELISDFEKALYESQSTKMVPFKTISMDIYWATAEKPFSEKRTAKIDVAVNYGVFEAKFRVKDRVEKLRIDFPDNDNAEFVINELRLKGKKNIESIDVKSLDFILKNNVDINGNLFVVTGRDPHFAIKTAPIDARTVLVRGVLK